ncbi:MAG: hypothetical protein MUD01_16310 [Chloroflexaceae bacterium]|jgi:hypothetical protein|nr:hypothetical protein [Chloroflexaceae bacterium]
MFTHRLVRGYVVLVLGVLLFFGRTFFVPDAADPAPFTGDWLSAVALRPVACFAGEPVCTEVFIVVGTALLIGLLMGIGNLRAVLIATAFALPPLMIYITAYPIWIVLIMLLLMPLMAHAALNAWLPRVPAPST